MKRMHAKRALLLISAGLLSGLSGSCLPANFFAELAGQVIDTSVSAITSAVLDALLSPANGG